MIVTYKRKYNTSELRERALKYGFKQLSIDVDMTPSYLSTALNDQKPLPEDRFLKLCEVLGFDPGSFEEVSNEQ